MQVEEKNNKLLHMELSRLSKRYGEAHNTKESLIEELNAYRIRNEKLVDELRRMTEIESSLNRSIESVTFNNENNVMHH